MAKSDALTLRIDRELKNKGNLMLKEMGITPSAFVNMAYSQLINQRRIPFEIRAKSVAPDLGMTDDEIETYAKIPTSFEIATPVGNYSPDWAVIAKKTDGTRKAFFVAESKGGDEEEDLKGVENAKIACARRHFAVVSNNNVKYDVVSSIGGLKRKLFG